MSSYWYKYQAYNAQIYTVITALALLAALLVIGWYLLRLLAARSRARAFYENGYLAACAALYILLIVAFTR